MKEIVVISGKGGTGKTSFTLALANILSKEKKVVCADCDVDAADMHIVMNPKTEKTTEFISGNVAVMHKDLCSRKDGSNCSICTDVCRFESFHKTPDGFFEIESGDCEGCMVCVSQCPSKAISFPERRCGEWYVSQTRFGTLVHAALDIRAENSGKLVTTVRKEAKKIAQEQNASYIIVDGSPGTGCPVIASITGCDQVVIVTEPTVSGVHDLKRVAQLAKHFSIPFAVIVNKASINTEKTSEIHSWCTDNSIPFLGEVPYNGSVTKAQIEGKTIIEYEEDKESRELSSILQEIAKEIV